MATSPTPRPVQGRFDAAVNVIKSLPNEGPYQPSNTTKLRFYALYKQVTQGPCTIPKPGFWDAVGRAKWEAWSVCGEMSREVAMQMYVEELQRLVETMPQTAEVEQFLRAIGPFYEEASDSEQPAPVTMETSTPVTTETPAETTLDKQTDKDVTPSEEGVPKSTNQIADEEEESGTESDSSTEDFKDSFQELADQPERRPTTSSPGHTRSLRQQPPISHGNRPTRSVTFAEPVRREPLPAMSALSSGGAKVQLSSPESYPLAIETVRSEITRLQSSIQSMLQQLNTLALAVNGLNRMMSSGERPSPRSLASQGDGAELMVPRLVTRRGRLLTMFIKAAPVLAAWPVVVTVVMAIIHKRFSRRPAWIWAALSVMQAVFTLLVASRLQR